MNDLQRELVRTADGSLTVRLSGSGITYHSTHGAVQESMHVFIRCGLDAALERFAAEPELRIFEMGFGTGLNALLTLEKAAKAGRKISYTAVELYPLGEAETAALHYSLPGLDPAWIGALHAAEWERPVPVTTFFSLHKAQTDLLSFHAASPFHLIYFDAFAPGDQPELWTPEVFARLYGALAPGGMLVTYCSKSVVRRAMQAAGFQVEKLPGPPGKREILRALKTR